MVCDISCANGVRRFFSLWMFFFQFFADFFDDFIAGIVVDCLFADLWLLIGVNVVDVLAKIMADG